MKLEVSIWAQAQWGWVNRRTGKRLVSRQAALSLHLSHLWLYKLMKRHTNESKELDLFLIAIMSFNSLMGTFRNPSWSATVFHLDLREKI